MHPIILLTALLGTTASAQGVTGTTFGFAAGTTGGGDATPAAPADITELADWLADDTPRVILIDKEFNFLGDKCVDCACCIPASNTCGSSGQNAIEVSFGWCGDSPKTTCTYDKAGVEGLDVGSNKSIVGVGEAGVIRGKGLRLHSGVSNIIIQNIHITELNPELIWGGDGISLDGTDMVWIDHVKISLVGRQMIVTGFDSSGRVTISNSDFDGKTDWSASCDGHHYWTILGLGKDDKVTFANNYIHQTSGRAPKLGYPNFWHVYNNYWYDNTGHAFDVDTDANALVEGNVFENIKSAYNDEGAGNLFVVDSSDEATCSSSLGRSCVPNLVTDSGTTAVADQGVLSSYSTDEGSVSIMPADQVAAYVLAHAGVGKLDAAATATATTPSSAPSTTIIVPSSIPPSSIPSAVPTYTSSPVYTSAPTYTPSLTRVAAAGSISPTWTTVATSFISSASPVSSEVPSALSPPEGCRPPSEHQHHRGNHHGGHYGY